MPDLELFAYWTDDKDVLKRVAEEDDKAGKQYFFTALFCFLLMIIAGICFVCSFV